MVITKQQPIADIKNIKRKESKHTTKESHQTMKEENKKRKKTL